LLVADSTSVKHYICEHNRYLWAFSDLTIEILLVNWCFLMLEFLCLYSVICQGSYVFLSFVAWLISLSVSSITRKLIVDESS